MFKETIGVPPGKITGFLPRLYGLTSDLTKD
jgi:hypothetical protein